MYRSEVVHSDQRYRVTGSWWVLIDGPESVGATDVLGKRSKVAIVSQKAATCPACDVSVESVPVLVVVTDSERCDMRNCLVSQVMGEQRIARKQPWRGGDSNPRELGNRRSPTG